MDLHESFLEQKKKDEEMYAQLIITPHPINEEEFIEATGRAMGAGIDACWNSLNKENHSTPDSPARIIGLKEALGMYPTKPITENDRMVFETEKRSPDLLRFSGDY